MRSAVQCAAEMQREVQARQAEVPPEQRLAFRVEIHVGEVVEDGEQLHGDGINIAVSAEGNGRQRSQLRKKSAILTVSVFQRGGKMNGRNAIACVALTGLLFGGAVAAPTFAQDRPCAADAKKFCQHVEPGDRQAIAQCLKDHVDDLSDACRDRMQAAKARGATARGALRDACAEDVRTLCGDVEPGGGRIGQCLKAHRDQLSSACKAAIAEARSNR
ncbi:MAG: hypothetical protein AB1671_02650 [Thermodesulfobacteriota bacterium]